MTPHLALEPAIAPASVPGSSHLTEEQFGDFLAASSQSVPQDQQTEAHLLSCQQCAAELADLRQSISLFRVASTTHANNELRRLPEISIPAGPAAPVQAYWAFAAAATLLVALLPMQTFRQHSMLPQQAVASSIISPSAESDDALLADINQEVSVSVPAPMQSLVDPTEASSITATTSSSTSDQRKD